MKEAMNGAKCNLARAQEQMNRQVDKAKRTKKWVVGDWVLPSTQSLQTFALHLPSKLERRWVAHSQLPRSLVQLPSSWICLLGGTFHPTFHASNLKACIQHPEFEWEVEPPPP